MTKNVLIFPCGSEVGLELYSSLHASTHFELYGASSTDDHGKFVYKKYIGELPYVNDENFIDRLNEVIDENGIDFIFPAHDSVVLKLAQAKSDGTLTCQVITSPIGTCETARSKLRTYEALKEVVPTPKVFDGAKNLSTNDLPVFLKPDIGQGSKGTHIAETLKDVIFYLEKDPSLLILEYLPGKEYTVDCFTGKNSTLLFCKGRERIRIANGISVSAAETNDKRLLQMAQQINQTLRFNGAWFFQVKENAAGDLVLMEVAPRIAGTSGFARLKGINLPLLSLFNAMGYDVSIFENDYNVVMDRALQNRYKHNIDYKHVYLDLDDLVIFNGKVSARVVAFVYQCHNSGVKLHLITRHKDDLETTLKKFRLSDAFDSLILVSQEQEKSDFITEKESIFIDDSFAERKKVHDKYGIPVFDAHMLEGLME